MQVAGNGLLCGLRVACSGVQQLSILSVVDYRAQMLQASDLLDQAALDPYTLLRDAYLQQRDARAGQAAPSADAGQAAGGDGYEPPLQEDGSVPNANAQAAGAGYEPPLESDQEAAPAARSDQAGAATAAPTPVPPADQGLTQQAEPASEQGAAMPAPTAAPVEAAGTAAPVAKPKQDAATPLRGNDGSEPQSQKTPAVPAVSGQTPHYWPVVPKWVDEVAPNRMGGSFWRR